MGCCEELFKFPKFVKPDQEKKRRCALIFAIFYALILLATCLTLGSVLIKQGNIIEEMSSQDTSYLKQLVTDWTMSPYTDIRIEQNRNRCEPGYEVMFSHMWHGHDRGCDCLNVCGPDMWGCWQMHVGSMCDYNQTRYGCDDYYSHPPIEMSMHDEKTICGKRSGVPFKDITRPDKNNKCPQNYNRCSDKTSAQDTICYHKDDTTYECPITDIQFILTSALKPASPPNSANYAKYNNYEIKQFNSTTSLIFSKKDGANLPLTAHLLEAKPCMDPTQSSLSPGQSAAVYPAEYTGGDCYFMKNAGYTIDGRYKQNGFYTTQFNLRDDNGVLDHMRYLPSYRKVGPSIGQLQSMKLTSWVRPTLSWDLTCETEKGYTREDGIQAASTHIDLSSIAARFDNVGMWMVIIYSLVTFGHCFPLASPVCSCIANILFIIFAPLVFCRVPKIMEENRENIDKLEDFTALNQCADQYTNIDVDRVDAELDQAYDALHTLNGVIGASLIVYLAEVVFLVFFFIYICCCFKKGKDHEDDYFKKDNNGCVDTRSNSSYGNKDRLYNEEAIITGNPMQGPGMTPQPNWNNEEAMLQQNNGYQPQGYNQWPAQQPQPDQVQAHYYNPNQQ